MFGRNDENEQYDPDDYTDSGELTQALEAVAKATGQPGLGAPGQVPTVVGFYYGGSPVVARLGSDEASLHLAATLAAMLRRIGSLPELEIEPEEPDPVAEADRMARAQLAALKRAAYAVGHPDGTETWKPHLVIEDLITEVRNTGPIE